MQSQPVIGKSVTSQKWERYKKDINNSRREKYKTNSEVAKSHSYKLYHQNPELFKIKKSCVAMSCISWVINYYINIVGVRCMLVSQNVMSFSDSMVASIEEDFLEGIAQNKCTSF